MIKAKWSQIDELCRAFATIAGPEASFWVEHAADVVAGDRPDQPLTPCNQRVAGDDRSEVLAYVGGRDAHAWIDLFAMIVRTVLAQQITIADMAAATAKTWRQMNALLAMAASTSLGLEPGKTIQRVFDLLARATRLLGGIALVRLPGSDECIQLDANGIQRVPTEILRGLDEVDAGVHTLTENDDSAVSRACKALLDPYRPAAVARLQTERDHFGWLVAASEEELPSDDLKLFGAASRIVAVAIENAHTLSSEREAMREEVERSATATLTDCAPAAMFRVGTENDVEYVNERWTALTGIPLELVAGEGWLAIVHPEDRARVEQAWERTRVEGVPLRVDHRCVRPDGEKLWLRTEIIPLGGASDGYVGVSTDITERRNLEILVGELEAEVERLLESGVGAEPSERISYARLVKQADPVPPVGKETVATPVVTGMAAKKTAMPAPIRRTAAGRRAPAYLSFEVNDADRVASASADKNAPAPATEVLSPTGSVPTHSLDAGEQVARPQRKCDHLGPPVGARPADAPQVSAKDHEPAGEGLLERLVSEFAAEHGDALLDEESEGAARVVRLPRTQRSDGPGAAGVGAGGSRALVARKARTAGLRARLLAAAPEAKRGDVKLLGEHAKRSSNLLAEPRRDVAAVAGEAGSRNRSALVAQKEHASSSTETPSQEPVVATACVASPFGRPNPEAARDDRRREDALGLLLCGFSLD